MDCSREDFAVPIKDETAAHPIAVEWRPTFCEIVRAFVERDYSLSRGVRQVRQVSIQTANQIRDNVAAYGATLMELPEEAWQTSCAQWMHGHWDVLVDLWTAEEGRSDLVLDARVFETDGGFQIEVHLVYVP
jgi:hypothetical protein